MVPRSDASTLAPASDMSGSYTNAEVYTHAPEVGSLAISLQNTSLGSSGLGSRSMTQSTQTNTKRGQTGGMHYFQVEAHELTALQNTACIGPENLKRAGYASLRPEFIFCSFIFRLFACFGRSREEAGEVNKPMLLLTMVVLKGEHL